MNAMPEFTHQPTKKGYHSRPLNKKEHFLLVDGYNIVFDWEELVSLANESLYLARDRLIHILSNYAGHANFTVILVFDAHESKKPPSVNKKDGIWVIYTAFSETADEYIEKTTKALTKYDLVTVATSDALEQMIIIGYGARRMSARDLAIEVAAKEKIMQEQMKGNRPIKNNMLIDNVDPKTAQFLENLRRQ